MQNQHFLDWDGSFEMFSKKPPQKCFFGLFLSASPLRLRLWSSVATFVGNLFATLVRCVIVFK